MKSAFYAGASGLMAHQEALDIIGHNLANSNTNGFKSQGVSFNELLYDRMAVNTPADAKNGHGVKAVQTGLRLGQGAMQAADPSLSFAVAGDGFFGVEGRDGAQQYTRDGDFTIGLEGESPYLVTQDGAYVLNQDGDRIEIPRKKTEGKDEKETEALDFAVLTEELGLFRFANPAALAPVSSNRYTATVTSGEAQEVERGEGEEGQPGSKVLIGFLERSGTAVAEEMTNMITAQRSYQISARVIQVADEVEQVVNSLRK